MGKVSIVSRLLLPELNKMHIHIIVLFNVLLSLGLCQPHLVSSEETNRASQLQLKENFGNDPGNRKVLRRVGRSTFASMRDAFATKMENLIIANCKANGHETEKLQSTFDDLKECFNKKKIFVTPKEEYLTSIEECSRDSIREVKNCLEENQSYFPDLLLSLAKSVVKFLYNDFDIIRVDMVACLPKLQDTNVLRSYTQCLHDVSVKNHDKPKIPVTKTEFCQAFVPTAYCFTNMVKEHCERTPGLAKYREDYIRSHKDPCTEKETA